MFGHYAYEKVQHDTVPNVFIHHFLLPLLSNRFVQKCSKKIILKMFFQLFPCFIGEYKVSVNNSE